MQDNHYEEILKSADGMRMIADEFVLLAEQITAMTNALDEIAKPLEHAAHEHLKATHGYRRAGQYPSLTTPGECDEYEQAIESDGAVFRVANGIDHSDNFRVKLTWEQLAMDPAQAARNHDHAKAKAEQKAARVELARAKARARKAGIDT